MNMWLVGAGYWGQKLRQDLEILGVTAKIIDIKNNQSIDDIDTLDPVMLATPVWEHYHQVCQLLQRGHDVYVEKPMAENYNQTQTIKQYITPQQILMVGHLFIHHPQLALIKKIIDQGNIGKLEHISSRRLNWGIYQTKTDPLLSLAVHDISIVLEFCQQPVHIIQAQGHDYSANVNYDRVTFGGTDGDLTFDVDVSWCWPQRVRETVFIGRQGQIVWNQDTNTVTVTRHAIVNNRAIPDLAPTIYSYDRVLTPLQHELQHWIECIKNRSQPITGIAAAAQVANVVDLVKMLI